jgi:hypothetical protein
MERGKSETVQLAAAIAILDRGHGKPAQALEVGGPDGERLFPPEQLQTLTDAQLTRLRTFLQEFCSDVEGNGGPPP